MGLRDVAIATFLRAVTAPRPGDAMFERQVLFAESGAETFDRRGAAVCQVPATGWWCAREAGHDGPCAAQRSDLSL